MKTKILFQIYYSYAVWITDKRVHWNVLVKYNIMFVHFNFIIIQWKVNLEFKFMWIANIILKHNSILQFNTKYVCNGYFMSKF